MKKYLCCFKGESSSSQVERGEPSVSNLNPPEATDSSETIDGDLDEQHPFGNNEFLNHAWLNNIELPDDRYPQGSSSSNPPPLPRPRLSHFVFRWPEIMHGTRDLNDTNLLGEGNFGAVYHCDLPRINKVGAAKVQNMKNAEAHDEFVAEIRTLNVANHPNVVTLLGKCVTRARRVIVYEFMPKGSLDHHIYNDERPDGFLEQANAVLDWDTRMDIALGVADALIYIHNELKTIHRDLKLSNVLLDEGFVPKLTDFGLATKIVENEDGVEQQSEIMPIKGTPGCIAPETETFGMVSTRSDVYSYGVFLITLFTGKKAYDRRQPPGEKRLTDRLRKVWGREENIPLLVDSAMGNMFSLQGFERLLQAARMCMDPQVLARPNMRVVKSMVLQAAGYEIPEFPLMPRISI